MMNNYFKSSVKLLALLALIPCFITENFASERKVSMNENWKFYRGCIANAEQTSFKDTQWRELDLHAERNDEDNEMLDEFFRSHPTVKNGITFNSKVYIIGEYLQSHGKKDFNLIGYDLLERNVACLKEGSVFFLIAQQPELQGANGIKALCDHLIFKKEVTCINYMPIDLLTVETIDYYHNK